MKIVDDSSPGAPAAPRAGAKERQDGRWLGDLERAWLASWTQMSGHDQDQRPESSPLPQGPAGAKPTEHGRENGAIRPSDKPRSASADSHTAGVRSGVQADARNKNPRPFGPTRNGTERSVAFTPVQRVQRPSTSDTSSLSGVRVLPLDSRMDSTEAAVGNLSEPLQWAASQNEHLAPDKLVAGHAGATAQAVDAVIPPAVQAGRALSYSASNPGLTTAGERVVGQRPTHALHMPGSSAEPEVASQTGPALETASVDHQGAELAAPEATDEAHTDQIAHRAPAYFPVQEIEAVQTPVPNAGIEAAVAISQVNASRALAPLSGSGSAADASATAAPTLVGKSGNTAYGTLGLSHALESNRPGGPSEGPREGPEEAGDAGANSRATAATQGPPPEKTSLNVSTSGDAAQVTVRDSSLSGDDVLRVGHMLALQLQQLGFSSVKTYVNGVARRVDSAYSSETVAIDPTGAEPAPEVKPQQ